MFFSVYTTAEVLVIYSQFRCFSQILPILIAKLIVLLFIILLHTFSMGVNICAQFTHW